MLQHIDSRLVRWADWLSRRQGGGLGFPRESCCVRIGMPKSHSMSGGYCEDIDVEAGQTEDIVTGLGEVLKVAVITWYVRGGTVEQKARQLGISVNSLKKYIDVAHNRIEDEIKSIKARSNGYPAGIQA